MESRIYKLYLKLRKKHGQSSQYWPQWCSRRKTKRTRERIAIGAILTQRTSWHNADLAIQNLAKRNLFSVDKISKLKTPEKLIPLIRAAGFYQSKPKRLYDLCCFISQEKGVNNLRKQGANALRQKLLSISGVGPETADTILLYSLGKPSFVIDEYTKRLVKSRGLSNNFNYNYLKNLFEKNLPKSVSLYQDFHALIIVEQKGEKESIMKQR